MQYEIEITAVWRWHDVRDPFWPGVYRVPTDVSEALAQRALRQGIARKVSRKSGPPENKAQPSAPEDKSLDEEESASGPLPQPGGSPESGRETLSLSSQAVPRSARGRPRGRGGKRGA